MNTKRTAICMAIVMCLMTLFGSAVPSLAVSDISGHWAEQIIVKWLDAGKINGYEDGTFQPDRNVTRAEFATILSNLVGEREASEEPIPQFADVSQDDWFYDNVMKLVERGVISEGEYFYPNEYITRQDAMSMAGRAFYVRDFEIKSIEQFADFSEISEYAQIYVAGFVSAGYVVGYEDNTIRPQNPITRAECLKMLDGLDLVHDKNSLKGILDRVYDGVTSPLPDTQYQEITNDNVEYFLGLKNMDNIEEAVASDAMMMATAHSVCLVRAKDGADVEALKEEIRTSANPRKWICVGVDPEDVIVVNQGNLILLVMSQAAPQEIADSFMALDLSSAQNPPLVPGADGLLYTNGYYMDDIGELRPNSVVNFANKIETVSNNYLQNSTGIYYAVVPSKSYFVNDRLQTPFDYDTMNSLLQENVKSATYIDLFDTLTLEDYYKTDPHWRQESLQGVVDKLGEYLGFQIDLSQNQVNIVEDFTGQHGYKKENFPSEQLIYLTNEDIDNAYVDNMMNENFHQVYELDKLSSDSPYDMFLSGPTPITTITNEQAASDKELVIFRDSFACSLAPLLIENYKTITLVDLRYVPSQILGDYVSFDGKDVLFLYNEQVVNFSEMLK